MLQKLNTVSAELKALRTLVRKEPKRVFKKGVRTAASTLASTWLSETGPALALSGQIVEGKLAEYTEAFRELLRISGPGSFKVRYDEVLGNILKDFRNDLILPLHEKPATSTSLALLTGLFKGLAVEEDDYLKEAIGCAQRGFLKASAILGWCAAIDRIHRKIEAVGFATFNVTSAQMASQTKGRFKKFSQVQSVQTIGELREVFDNIILWIIEGMQLIDSNQHTRLRSCFEMRCQSAHPGDAPIKEFNLLSFYSDIREIVLENPKFALPGKVASSPPAIE